MMIEMSCYRLLPWNVHTSPRILAMLTYIAHEARSETIHPIILVDIVQICEMRWQQDFVNLQFGVPIRLAE